MKKNSIRAILLAGLVLILPGCQTEDSGIDSSTPVQALITAKIGKAPASPTRAADGFDGPVKKQFVEGDQISIAYKNGTADKNIQATLSQSGIWETPTGFYINDPALGLSPGSIIATYGEADTEANGSTIYADSLRAVGVVAPPAVPGAPYTVGFTFEHTRALLRATFADASGQPLPASDIDDALIRITNDGGLSGKTLNVKGPCIVPAGYSILSALVLQGGNVFIISQFTTASGSPLVTEAGKSYTLSFTLGADGIRLFIEESTLPTWNTSTYDRLPNTDAIHYIYNATDLANFRDEVNKGNRSLNALQMADIELPANTNWEPIGSFDRVNYDDDYNGTYNGNGFTIKNLQITQAYNAAGLFGCVKNATLVNIHLIDAIITPATGIDNSYIGTLVGLDLNNSTIALCSSSGTVESNDDYSTAGGLVGYLGKSHLSRSRSSCAASANGIVCFAAGLVGANDEGIIAACMAEGDAETNGEYSYAGGLTGLNNGIITHCYATGTATASINGGLTASNNGGIYYSYTSELKIKGKNNGEIVNCWCSKDDGFPSIVYSPVDEEYKKPVNTWVNGQVQAVIFGPDIWTPGEQPTLKYNSTGTVQ